jgi:FtsP/CotA-like multicopper oxidase with cupredoxin domain
MKRLLLAGLAAAAVALPAAAQAGPAAPPVPGDVAVPAGHKPSLVAHAEGVQIYDCVPVPGGYAWRLAAPRATLTGDNGKTIGSHYGGPTWEARDGSRVTAKRDGGVNVDPTAVDWLRLKADSTSAGADGDRFSGTSYIQRINTVGGLSSEAGDCNEDTMAERREVPYTADYVFFKETR